MELLTSLLNVVDLQQPAGLSRELSICSSTVVFSEFGDSLRNSLQLTDRSVGCRYYGGSGTDPDCYGSYILFQRPIAVLISCRWKDQGWGERKGECSLTVAKCTTALQEEVGQHLWSMHTFDVARNLRNSSTRTRNISCGRYPQCFLSERRLHVYDFECCLTYPEALPTVTTVPSESPGNSREGFECMVAYFKDPTIAAASKQTRVHALMLDTSLAPAERQRRIQAIMRDEEPLPSLPSSDGGAAGIAEGQLGMVRNAAEFWAMVEWVKRQQARDASMAFKVALVTRAARPSQCISSLIHLSTVFPGCGWRDGNGIAARLDSLASSPLALSRPVSSIRRETSNAMSASYMRSMSDYERSTSSCLKHGLFMLVLLGFLGGYLTWLILPSVKIAQRNDVEKNWIKKQCKVSECV